MKKRKVLFWATLLLTIIGFLGTMMWHLWEVEEKLEVAIRGKLETVFSNKLQVGQINLAIGRLHLSDIRYNFDASPFLLSISDISISYNILSFIKSGFKIGQTSNEIIITAPKITYILRDNPDVAQKLTQQHLAEVLKKQYQAAIKSIEFINNASVSNGSVFIIDSLSYAKTGRSKTYAVVQGVNGWIETQKSGKAFARLAGRFFNSEKYTANVIGSADLSQGTLDSLVIELDDYQFEKQILSEFPKYLTGVDGLINGFLRLDENHDEPGYLLSGKLHISNGKMALTDANIFLEDLVIDSKLNNFDFFIEHGEFRLNGSPVQLGGSITNLLSPSLNINLYSPGIDLRQFARRLNPKSPFPVTGFGEMQLAVRESIDNPQFQGLFVAENLSLINRPLDQLSIAMAFRDSTLYLNEVHAQFLHANLEAWGQLSFKNPQRPLTMHLVADGAFFNNLEHIIPFKIPANMGALDAELKGPLKEPVLRGNYSVSLPMKNSPSIDLLGHFLVDDWNFRFSSGSIDNKFQMNGLIANLNSRPFYQIQVKNMGHVLKPFGVQPVSQIADRYSIDAEFSGVQDEMALKISGFNFKSKKKHFNSTIVLDRLESEAKKITGEINFFPDESFSFVTSFAADLNDTALVFTKLGNQHWLDGHCRIDFKENKTIDAELRVANLELSEIIAKNDDGTPRLSGRLLSKISIKGELGQPEISTESWLLGAKYNGIGLINADLKADLHNNSIQLSRFSISRNNNPLIRAKGKIDLSPFAVDVELKSRNLDINDVILAVTRKDSILGGLANIDIKIKGESWPAPVSGAIKLQSGNLLWFKFDELAFNFSDSTAGPDSAFISFSGMRSNSITYTRKDQFVLNGGGYVPFNGHENLDVHLSGYGNIFTALHDFVPLLTAASSSCALEVGLRGPYKKVQLVDSKLTVADGNLSFAEVIKNVHHINGEAVTEDNFIHIKSFMGTVGNATLAIHNTRLAPPDQGLIGIPLIINDNWMNLGTIHFKSSSNGLPLNIPGLMPKNEIGRFQFHGREKSPAFLVGGPWLHPVFRGEVVLDDVPVIFPYYEESERPSPLIEYIMLNSNWDVHAIAGKNNRYVAEFSNIGIDQVIINAGIDDGISQLTFTGIIIDTSQTYAQAYALNLALNQGDSATRFDFPDDSINTLADAQPAMPLEFQQKLLRSEAGPDTSSFRIEGQIESTRGTIEYLDLNFRVDKFVATWDKSSLDPIVWGQAWTTIPDTLKEHYVYLKLQAKDPVTGEFKERGRYEQTYFKLESEMPIYNTSQMHVLSLLGYAPENIADKNRTTNIIGASTENLLLRPLLRPVERKLERSLGLDIVRFNSRFTQNFLNNNQFYSDFTTAFLQNTQLTLGKYISNKMYFLYTGRFSTNARETGELNYLIPTTIGLKHSLGLEYRFNPSLLLQLGYKYNEASYLLPKSRQDKNILIRYSFPF